jgi:hypothetical protein
MGSLCFQHRCLLLLQGQGLIVEETRILSVRMCDSTVTIGHETGFSLWSVSYGIDYRVRGSSVSDLRTSGRCRQLPLVRDEPTMYSVDLIVVKHRGVLIEDPGLWQGCR